jgi:cytochrome b pre-mRNA-processing protein 3
MLHMYILSARLRCFPANQAHVWQQHLLDHFFYAAEDKMTVAHGMHARGTRNKYLKDLFVQWRGLLAAYDEGVYQGDTVLAAAVWRNLFKADDDVDARNLAQVVSYMRHALRDFDDLEDERLWTGELNWPDLKQERMIVGEKSVQLEVPLSQESH